MESKKVLAKLNSTVYLNLASILSLFFSFLGGGWGTREPDIPLFKYALILINAMMTSFEEIEKCNLMHDSMNFRECLNLPGHQK